jgi:hypothetical protein
MVIVCPDLSVIAVYPFEAGLKGTTAQEDF